MSKICPNCHYPNDDNAKVCQNCRADITPENLANQERLNWEKEQNKTQDKIISSMKLTLSDINKFETIWFWFVIIVGFLLEVLYIVLLALTGINEGNAVGIFVCSIFIVMIPFTTYICLQIGRIILHWFSDMLRFQWLGTKQSDNLIHLEKNN